MKLNSLNLNDLQKKKEKEFVEEIDQKGGKTGGRGMKGQNLELVFQLMDLKEVRCLFI